MKRGEIWTVSGGAACTGKPRPAAILQDDQFDGTDSVTLCGFTTDETDAPLFRLPIEPNERNGLKAPARLMVDQVTTVARARLGSRIGRLDPADLVRLNQGVFVFLGLAGSPRTRKAP